PQPGAAAAPPARTAPPGPKPEPGLPAPPVGVPGAARPAEPRPSGRDVAVPPLGGRRTLHILIDVRNNKTISQIIDTLEIGAGKARCRFDTPPVVRPAAPASRRHVSAPPAPRPGGEAPAAGTGATLTAVSFDPPTWQIDLDPRKRIVALEVEFPDGTTRTFKPDVPGTGAGLTMLF